MPNSVEARFERLLLASRWLLVPLYLVVLLMLLGFAYKAVLELLHIFQSLLSITESELVLAALSLIDLALVGDLAVMVALSGYETMVSRIDATPEMEKPNWLGKYDSGTIKLKVASSLVAISAIHLLKTYLNSGDVPLDRLMVMTGVHLAFVVSALILAYVDRIAFASHREPGH
ncbi:MAG: putative inner rane protein [Nevskia sp.]|nr:putative inner rane protein [Nevskia sp.]